MTTHAAAAAGAAANGAVVAPAASAAVKKEASPVPDPKAAASGAPGSRGATPAATADGHQASKSSSPMPAARATPEAGAATADGAAPTQEDEEQRRLEDEILAEGQAIAGVRALLARAFSRPAEEPAVPLGHWTFLMREATWLAHDMAQERLWKQAAALAVAYEVAKLRGKFGLRPPPEGQRQYHDDIVALRTAAAKETAEKTGGRRSAIKAAAEANGTAALKLDPAEDPVFQDLEGFELSIASLQVDGQPSTPASGDPTAALSLVFRHDAELQEALELQLLQADTERMMREETTAREYRFEYEAALASHHMAVQEQNRRAMRLDADMADAEGLAPMDEEGGEEDEYGAKKAKARKRLRGGYLLDDFAGLGAGAHPEETESMGGVAIPKQKAASRQFIEDTYLQRKRRRERYKDVDVDYDVGMENAARYGTRANRAIATRAGASRAQDPNKRKQQLGRTDSFAGVPGGGGMAARGGTRLPPGAVPGPVIWAKAEDDLLLAITHEFGVNWTMVSEVLSLSLSMQGIFRPPHLCKQRFRQITTPLLQQQAAAALPPGTEVANIDYSEEKALMALYMVMTKQQARELIVTSLPVHDDVLMRMLEALVQVGAAARQRKQLEDKRSEANRKVQETHPSHAAVRAHIMAKTGNKHLTPQELAAQVELAYAQQAKQQQMLAQQAQQAAQMQQGGTAPAQGQPAAAPGGGGGGVLPAGTPGAQGGRPPPCGTAQGMPAPAQGIAAGTPAGAPGMPSATPQQQQAVAAGMPGAGTPPLPTGMPPTAGAASQQQAANMIPPARAQGTPLPSPGGPAPRPASQGISLQQLNHILETGKLPNGQPLTPEQRKAIGDKRNTVMAQMAQMQQQRQMQMQMQHQQAAAAAAAGGGVGGGPGQPSAATQAALQAAQQAAAVQAGMRPPMGMQGMYRPGMPGGAAMGQPGPMPGQPGMPGMPMQPALLQQQMAQMAAAGGAPGMQQMQPGMQLPPAAQQQLIAQQFAMQQQAAAAAAAQQQAAAVAAAQGGQPPQAGS